jgi:hypothetical protein
LCSLGAGLAKISIKHAECSSAFVASSYAFIIYCKIVRKCQANKLENEVKSTYLLKLHHRALAGNFSAEGDPHAMSISSAATLATSPTSGKGSRWHQSRTRTNGPRGRTLHEPMTQSRFCRSRPALGGCSRCHRTGPRKASGPLPSSNIPRTLAPCILSYSDQPVGCCPLALFASPILFHAAATCSSAWQLRSHVGLLGS